MRDVYKVAFIGAGKVGFSLGRFFVEGGIQVTGYYSRHRESAKQAAQFTKTHDYEDLESLVRRQDVSVWATRLLSCHTRRFRRRKPQNVSRQLCLSMKKIRCQK